MMTENEGHGETLVCQRASAKRRKKSKSLTCDNNASVSKQNGNGIRCFDQTLLKPAAGHDCWIDNSFGEAVKPPLCVHCPTEKGKEKPKDSSELMNNSDLLLAQIDIEELSNSSQATMSHTVTNSSNTGARVESQTEASGSCSLNVSDNGDLFEEDDMDAIFFPTVRDSSQNIYNREMTRQFDQESCESRERQIKQVADFDTANNDDKLDQSAVCENQKIVGQIDIAVKDKLDVCVDESPLEKRHPISLKERLKERLLMNASTAATVNHCGDNKLREEELAKARMEASQIRKEGTSVDIGPFHGLPSKVEELFKSLRGVSRLYVRGSECSSESCFHALLNPVLPDWQNECLSLPAVKQHHNLIYTLPTSGGKTLVAEILILRELLCHQKDALLVLPFVSIVQEKVRTITEFASELDFLVEEYAGSKGRFPPIKRRKKRSLYIASIEKGHSLINSLIATERLDSLGLVVVDEMHMLGEGGSRGANLESMLLKILHAEVGIQIVGMSATLNNLEDLQTFLQADIYANDFRPVCLQEYIKVEDNIYEVNNTALDSEEKFGHSRVALFPYPPECLKRDPDHLLGLVTEVIPEHSCLVFCSTKKNCENVAQLLSEMICKHYRKLSQVKKEQRKMLLQELHQDGNGQMCPVLKYTVHFGIAYHHSGLTMDERRLIEDAYLDGTLCVLTCTSTLAAGVNLPARRVILRSPYVGMNFMKYSQYKQMTGRAGRAGIDSHGESFLITKIKDKLKVKELLAGPKDYCYSSLMYLEGKGIQSLLLSAIGLQLISSTDSAFRFLERSLLYIQAKKLEVDMSKVTKEALQYLIDQQLVVQGLKKLDVTESLLSLQVTDLGRATFKGSVDHAYSRQLYEDLKVAEQSLVLSNHFHLLYLVTPYDTAVTVTPSWDIYYHKYSCLSEAEIHVAKLIGISENYLNRKAVGLSSRQKIDILATNRFFLTLMLWKMWNQNSFWDVASQFSQPRGFIQNLLVQSAAFASCVYHFCQELEEFWAFQDLLANFVKRLSYCVTVELVPLMEISGIKVARAKQLYGAGLTSLASLAAADADELVAKIQHLSRRQANQIVSAAKNVVEEKTAALLEEVETLVSVPNTTS